MDNERALEIINALASGVDPFTGEVYGEDNVLQNPEAVRALFLASRALEGTAPVKRSKQRKPSDPLPANAGEPWSEAEDRKLIDSFESGQTHEQLAKGHERTLGAIRSRLERLGKLQPPVGGYRT